MTLVEFVDIKKRFGKSQVLSGISLGIQQGEIFGLVGTSGCGKSTLLKILIGMSKADNGKIYFDGKDAFTHRNYLRKNTGFATQENMLFQELTVKENSFYFGKLYGMKRREIKERLRDLISLLRLDGFEHAQIKNLSGGMAKRADLLVSLIHNPKLLILDEPTAGLDPVLRNSVWEYIRKINKTGTTILVTSHLIDEIEQNCRRIAIMKNGRVIGVGSVDEYKKSFGEDKTFTEIFMEVVKHEGNYNI